jgi:hypothetical protein
MLCLLLQLLQCWLLQLQLWQQHRWLGLHVLLGMHQAASLLWQLQRLLQQVP